MRITSRLSEFRSRVYPATASQRQAFFYRFICFFLFQPAFVCLLQSMGYAGALRRFIESGQHSQSSGCHASALLQALSRTGAAVRVLLAFSTQRFVNLNLRFELAVQSTASMPSMKGSEPVRPALWILSAVWSLPHCFACVLSKEESLGSPLPFVIWRKTKINCTAKSQSDEIVNIADDTLLIARVEVCFTDCHLKQLRKYARFSIQQ